MAGKPIDEAVDLLALDGAAKYLSGRYGESDGWVQSIRAAISALTAAQQQQGQAVAWQAEVQRAIERARVFDDGSDGADAESAQSVVGILSGLLNELPMRQGGGGGGEVWRHIRPHANEWQRVCEQAQRSEFVQLTGSLVEGLQAFVDEAMAAPPSAPVGVAPKGYVITPSTPLFHKLGEHLHRLVNLADDTIDLDSCIGMAVDAARSALADYLAMHQEPTT